MRVLAIAVGVITVAATPADAGWRIDRATAIAAKVWRDPCPNKVQIRWVAIPATGIGAEDVADAAADRFTCTIWLRSTHRWDWEPLCSALIHEYGHLAGMPHSLNPRSVMYEFGAYMEDFETRHGRKISSTVRWTGTDRRCRNRGRTYLGLLPDG
jgi:hypothetical protein